MVPHWAVLELPDVAKREPIHRKSKTFNNSINFHF